MSIIDRTQSIASAGFYRLGARALAKSIGRSHQAFIEPLDPDTTYFHITHPKAASQWVQSILQNLYRDAVVKNLPAAGSVAGGNVEALHHFCTSSAAAQPKWRIRWVGLSSIWRPIFPALTIMVSRDRQEESSTVRYAFFMPTGEQPPLT